MAEGIYSFEEKRPPHEVESLPAEKAELSCKELWLSLDQDGQPMVTATIGLQVHLSAALKALVDHHKSRDPADAGAKREKRKDQRQASNDTIEPTVTASSTQGKLTVTASSTRGELTQVKGSSIKEFTDLCTGMEERIRDAISALRKEQAGLSSSLQALQDEIQTGKEMRSGERSPSKAPNVAQHQNSNEFLEESLNRTLQTHFQPVQESQDKTYRVIKDLYKQVLSSASSSQDAKAKVQAMESFVRTLAESAVATQHVDETLDEPSSTWSFFMGSSKEGNQKTQLQATSRLRSKAKGYLATSLAGGGAPRTPEPCDVCGSYAHESNACPEGAASALN